ncbi:17298_t:CDS:2, partial [Cetraspora pellucida]
KLLPFVFILIGIENMFTLIDAVAVIPAHLDVKERVAQGLEKVGYIITKTLAIWLLLLLICSMTNIDSIKEFCIFTSIAMIIIYILHMSFFVATLSIDLKRSELEILFNNPISNSNNDTNANNIPLLKTINYGRKISGLLVILIFLVAVPNSPYLKFAFDKLNDSSVIKTATNINITFWETSIADKFWDIMSMDKKDQFAIIQPTRELTLFYSTEHDNGIDTFYSFNNYINWKLITKNSLKTFILSLKFITVPAIVIIFLTSFLVGYSLPLDLIIRKTGKSVGNKIILPVSSLSGSSALCFATLRVITLRGRHSADVDLLCANFNGVIISTSTDRHITSWDGRQGIPLKKLERYMRRCETCKCDSTGGLKNCITWPVRAICMSEKIDLVAAGFDDGVVRVWDINSGQAIYILKYTVEDIEQMTPTINHTCEKVTCLQIVVPNLHSSYDTSESTSNKKTPSMILATYLNGYFREWDLISGQIAHTVFTHQKDGISCLFVVDDEKQNYIQDELHIFTGARDGSVKCWSRTVHNPEDESKSTNSYCRSMWKLLYTIPGNYRNAITSIAAKVVKTKKSCVGIVVTGAANGEVKVYDYLTGQPMVTLSCGTFEKHHNAKECGEQLLFQRKLFTNQDLLEKYGYELPDQAKGNVSHKDAVTNIIIHKLKEECCPCGNTVETSGFSITTSSLDEKVYFWQLIRNTINCVCMVSNISDSTTDDNNNKDASERRWDDILGSAKSISFNGICIVQIGSKVVAQFFYRHAKFCASHPIFMIVLEIFIVLLLCYPAFDTYYLNPVKNVNHPFFCDVSPSKPQILKETFADKYEARPLFYVEQVIIKIANLGENNEGESASVLKKNLLLWILGLQERIENTVIRYPSLSSSIASIRYTLSDICFKPFSSNSCLIHSPLDYWLNNVDRLSHDSSIQATLSLANKIYLEKFIPLNSVFGNVVYKGRRIISADSIILTYFLKEIEDSNKGLTISIWKEIWNQIINDINTTFFLGDDPIKS